MRALLSIRPEHVVNIFNGSKTFEFRRRIFSPGRVNTVLVYATMPVGRIVGEFDVDDIICDTPQALWSITQHGSGITRGYFDEYFHGRDVGFALKIGRVREYAEPLVPADVFEDFTPPQSYLYVERKERKRTSVHTQGTLFA